MSEVKLFGRRREIERLRFDLALAGENKKELEAEIRYLNGVRTAQAATVDMLTQELRASDELIRQLKATEKKLFQMYNASEAARQELARKARERETPHQSPSATASPDEDYRLGPLGQKGRPSRTEEIDGRFVKRPYEGTRTVEGACDIPRTKTREAGPI